MNKPLTGIRVIDLTHMLAGPYGGMILADLGADTIKVEPLRGEGTRKLLATDPNNSVDGMGAYFLTLNRNKRAICIDLKSEKGLELFYDLVKEADVVLSNFGPGVTKKLKIDLDHLAKVNTKIITCSISGFGSDGPGHKRPAFDQVAQAYGGGMSITGTDADHPIRGGIPTGDLGGGMFAVMGIQSALLERERSGQGQHVDISMVDVQVSLLNYMASMYFLSGEDPFPIGNSHFVHVPYNSYPTQDGHLVICVITDNFWHNLKEVVQFEGFEKDEFDGQPGRLAAKDFIDGKLTEIFSTNTTKFWLKQLEEKRIPAAPVNRFSEALNDEQVLHRKMVVEITHPNGQKAKVPGNPIKFSRTNEESFSSPPLLGQNTDEVLTDIMGKTAAEIASLREAGVIK